MSGWANMSVKTAQSVKNTDTDAKINILRKVVPDALLGNSGAVDVPIRIKTLDVKLQ